MSLLVSKPGTTSNLAKRSCLPASDQLLQQWNSPGESSLGIAHTSPQHFYLNQSCFNNNILLPLQGDATLNSGLISPIDVIDMR